MAIRHCVAAVAGVLALLAGLCSRPSVGELIAESDSGSGVFCCTALVAHVRVAGNIPAGREVKRRDDDDEALWLVEILDAAQGPATGELVLVETRGARKVAEHFRAGETFLLFATREIDGVYRPLADDGVWPIDKAGKLTNHCYRKLLPPSVDATSPSDVTAWFWNEAQQHAFHVSIALNQDDLKHYDAKRALRLAIAVDNTGGRPLTINNAIEFEYDDRGDEMIEEKRYVASLPEVKVYARPLVRERVLSDLERMLQEESELTLSPGQRCVAEYDLAQEPQIYPGMRYQLWVEVGGRASPPIVFETPGSHEELALEKLAEIEGDGPFRLVRDDVAARVAMPDVQTTDQTLAIQAALQAWLKERPRREGEGPARDEAGCEIVLLNRAHLTADFAGKGATIRFAVVDRFLEPASASCDFQLSDAKATFRARTLRVEQVVINKQKARIVIRDVEADDSGLLAIVRLVRERGDWRTDGEIELAID